MEAGGGVKTLSISTYAWTHLETIIYGRLALKVRNDHIPIKQTQLRAGLVWVTVFLSFRNYYDPTNGLVRGGSCRTRRCR